MDAGTVSLFLCGDVMTGRGVDQILPYPGDPELREVSVRDARAYIRLAETANGPIPRPAGFEWPWGDALPALAEADVRVINLETSITRNGEFAPGKGVHYRMDPDNLPCLAVAEPDVCSLANNHVLDFGREGLAETLDVMAAAGLCQAGAGHDLEEARRPAAVTVGDGRRVLVFSFGTASSGVPPEWAAARGRPGIAFVPEPSPTAAAEIIAKLREARRPGDLVVVSVHWGSNWGYGISRAQVRFAHALIDGGVDVVHGHSSHHPRPIEVYRGRLILYGCGDLIDDYEGIRGYEAYRDDLRLLYFVSLDSDGTLRRLRMTPMRAERMRLAHAPAGDVDWLRTVLDRVSRGFGARIDEDSSGSLVLRTP